MINTNRNQIGLNFKSKFQLMGYCNENNIRFVDLVTPDTLDRMLRLTVTREFMEQEDNFLLEIEGREVRLNPQYEYAYLDPVSIQNTVGILCSIEGSVGELLDFCGLFKDIKSEFIGREIGVKFGVCIEFSSYSGQPFDYIKNPPPCEFDCDYNLRSEVASILMRMGIGVQSHQFSFGANRIELSSDDAFGISFNYLLTKYIIHSVFLSVSRNVSFCPYIDSAHPRLKTILRVKFGDKVQAVNSLKALTHGIKSLAIILNPLCYTARTLTDQVKLRGDIVDVDITSSEANIFLCTYFVAKSIIFSEKIDEIAEELPENNSIDFNQLLECIGAPRAGMAAYLQLMKDRSSRLEGPSLAQILANMNGYGSHMVGRFI